VGSPIIACRAFNIGGFFFIKYSRGQVIGMLLGSDIEKEYGITITKWVKIRDVYQVITQNHGILCLKSFAIPASEIRFIAQVINHLSETGFKYSPRILLTLNQSPWITSNETHYMVSNWVVGEQPDFNNKNHYKKALRILAKFHSAAQGFPYPDAPEARSRYNKLRKKVTSYRKILSEFPKMEHLISTCDEALDCLNLPTVVKAIEQEQAASAFVHGDYNYPNLVQDTSHVIHMIDFENTSLNVRMMDLSHILHRNFPWQGKETLRWIEYYDRKRPLSREDLHLLYSLLLVPYPVIRALLRKRQVQHNRNVLPTARLVRNYANELKRVL
jgi:CotS family spore coat protein